MKVLEQPFGKTASGQPVSLYTLENSHGISLSVMSHGAILFSLKAPDRNGKSEELTLGFDGLQGYLGAHPYFGATVGRFANRIGGGRFTLDGKAYTLACNEKGINHIHGGTKGFDKALWRVEAEPGQVTFSYTSPDGEEGYPGNLEVRAVYSLNEKNELTIGYTAETDRPTPVNLTNHTYWNLAGAGSGTVLNHELLMGCSRYLPVDRNLIPTGELRDVRGTPMDFTVRHPVGELIAQVPGGYDHCYVINPTETELRRVLELSDPKSGRCFELKSTQPGVQLYTGNFLNGIKGRGGDIYDRHSGLCLETQSFPDSVNKPGFPSSVLAPGELYRHATVLRFFTA